MVELMRPLDPICAMGLFDLIWVKVRNERHILSVVPEENVTDTALAIDAMGCCARSIETFVLIASDSDFILLAHCIRKARARISSGSGGRAAPDSL